MSLAAVSILSIALFCVCSVQASSSPSAVVESSYKGPHGGVTADAGPTTENEKPNPIKSVSIHTGFLTDLKNGTTKQINDEFSMNDGKCVYRNGTLSEAGGGPPRSLTEEEQAKIDEYKKHLGEFAKEMQKAMGGYLAKMVQGVGALDGAGGNSTGTSILATQSEFHWPEPPMPPCLCKVGC